MAYMSRLGLWGAGSAFEDFEAFLDSMKKRGVSFLEMLVRHLSNVDHPRGLPWWSQYAWPALWTRAARTPRCVQAMEMKLEGFYVARGLSFRCALCSSSCKGTANSIIRYADESAPE